ncbi:hypothetical protein DFJ58DRAFT_743144 [Suillus subalutaceus]|uniref:uncharacterized protein n=1 Tax=Suillus subalutaceus TaxID=48586 RepID=UPI001B86C059|nr:uncharacterized protein DFJ58DRAFT_743144 [Suillus subalutaceus]KAG1865784.1 hypothetical protein DFJ58DRAFT_743144 [Suillus subalutaceus]
MRGLNDWLERDVQDRQAELRGVTARVDELRNDLARLELGMQPSVQLPGVPPGHGVIPVGPIPPPPVFGPRPAGFVPQGVPEPPFIPTYDEPRCQRGLLDTPEPQHYLPDAQGPVIPGAYGGFPQPQHGDQHERRPGAEDERFFPTSPPQSSDTGLLRPFVPEHPSIVQQSDVEGRSDAISDTQHTYAPDVHHVPHPPEDQMLAPGHQQDTPAVIHSGEHTHSHGSPQPQPINFNVPPQLAPVCSLRLGMSDQPGPMPAYGVGWIPPPSLFVEPGSGPPLIIHPAPRCGSRSSSESVSGRRPVVIQQSPPSGPVVLQLPPGEQVARPPTHQEFGVSPSGGGPVVILPDPDSVRDFDCSLSRSRSPRRGYRDRYPPYDDPYSPDYDHPRHWDDRRRRDYSPEYGPRRRYDDYSPRRGGPRDYHSRLLSPRRRGERHRDDDPRRPRRHPDSPSPTRAEERDPSRREGRSSSHRAPTRSEGRGPSRGGSPTHRTSRRPSYEEGDRPSSHRTPTHLSHEEGDRPPTHRTPSRSDYEEGDGPRTRTPSRPGYEECDGPRTRTPSCPGYEEGDRPRTPTRLSHEGDHPPTQYSEDDVPGPSRHTSSHGQRTPSHGYRTPSHGIPASPRFEDPPRSPTVIRIEHPEHMHPESLTGRSMIIAPRERAFSPRRHPSDLHSQLRDSPDGYIPTIPSLHPVPSVRDGGRRPHSRAPSVTEHDDGQPPRHRLLPARGDEADPGGRRSASRFPDDEAGSRRAALRVTHRTPRTPTRISEADVSSHDHHTPRRGRSSVERDPGRTHPSHDEGDHPPIHRTPTQYSEEDASDRSHRTHSRRCPSYDEGDHPPTTGIPTRFSEAHEPSHGHRTLSHRRQSDEEDPQRGPSSYDEGDRSPTHRTCTQISEAHVPSHGHRTPSHGHRTPIHGFPASPRFEDPPRSPTVIRIEHEHGHSESLTGRPVIIAPGEQRPFSLERRSRSPTSELRHQLRHSPDVYIPTVYLTPSVRDDDGRLRRRTPSVTEHDDGRPRHQFPPARNDEADQDGRRGASRFPDDEAGPSRAVSRAPYDEADPYRHRAASQIPDDEADPGRRAASQIPGDEADSYGGRAASRVPSRTGSQAGRMPATIQRDDGSRQESEMIHIPPPADHGHPPDHDPDVYFDPTATGFDDALNRRHERLDEVERELNQVIQSAHEAEDRREAEFRDGEEHRQQIFLQSEQRRDDEARQRGDELFAHLLEESARSVPSLPDPPPPGSVDNDSIIESIYAEAIYCQDHADDILETVPLEREHSPRERESFSSEEQERAEFAAERARMYEECERRVHELEEELVRVRGELDSERQLRQTENEERAAANGLDEGMRGQIT